MIRTFSSLFALALAVAAPIGPAGAQQYPNPYGPEPQSAANPTSKPDPAMLGQARHFFGELQSGSVNRSELSSEGPAAGLNSATISNAQHMIGSLGTPVSFVQQRTGSQGGVTWAIYSVTFKNGETLDFLYGIDSNGKVTSLGLGTPH